ncbi:MAG: hypothetical protein OHK93_000179 [Ramalina farinacea]|uniref:ARID domain-containing protein n=1 Tax=Ramalina farinacea TaxID=258253 RepID=A0AA43QIQ5_9LECA|nr:hypothetical protein [Ramalina farinacea]
MSATNWMHDGQPFQNGEIGNFNGAGDPSMPYAQNPSPSSFDFHPLQAQQMPRPLQNGHMPNGPPSAQNQMYQTQATVPSKRPRPREDSIGGSPRPFAGSTPVSRAQTPHGTFTGYPGAVGGAPFPGSNLYQNMPPNAPSTGQSPAIPNQNFNPQTAQARMQTVSPSPFSPAGQSFGNHTSPPHSENGTRVNTPQSNGVQYPPNGSYNMGSMPPYMQQAAPHMNGVHQQQYGQQAHHDNGLMEARMRQLNQMGGLRAGAPSQAPPFGAMGHNPNQMSPAQMAQMRAQQAQQAQPRSQQQQPQMILQNLIGFQRARGIAFNPQPTLARRTLNSVQLFSGVLRMGGSRRIAETEQWPRVAQLLGYPLPECLGAGHELQNYWQAELAEFEKYWQQQTQQKRAMAEQAKMTGMHSISATPAHENPSSPTKLTLDLAAQINPNPPNARAGHVGPIKPGNVPQPHTPQSLSNGYTNSAMSQMQAAPSAPKSSTHNADLELAEATGNPPQPKSLTRSVSEWKPRCVEMHDMYVPRANNLELPLASAHDSSDETDPAPRDEGEQKVWLKSHGGLHVDDEALQKNVSSLLKFKLQAPLLDELGPVDIRALTLSLRSGISGEVRHALDTIATISSHPKAMLALDQCDDLTETLVECANEQVELLAENAPEVSDAMLINSYEETVRSCRAELEEVQYLAEFGTQDHELDKAVDKLICITTIIRNSSFFDSSLRVLTDPVVLKMMSTVMRYLGTRNMMLRTNQNALDFSKDVVIFLSQTAQYLNFQNKDEALCILHFLVSFAPLPEPHTGDNGELFFYSYKPMLHRYLPHAVDALAKLLTREPNRSFFRAIFTSESSPTPTHGLLTKAFGLAVSPVPDMEALVPGAETSRTVEVSPQLPALVSHRMPFLVQGLLAAEILISMIPGSDPRLASMWIHSQDRFASRLMRMLSWLSRKLPTARLNQPHIPIPSKEVADSNGYTMLTNRGLTVLKRLADRAKEFEGTEPNLPQGILPDRQTIFTALTTPTMDSDILRQLCNLHSVVS